MKFLIKDTLMLNYENKLIISQRYMQREAGFTVSLLDLCGNDAVIKTNNGNVQKIPLDNFTSHFKLILPV